MWLFTITCFVFVGASLRGPRVMPMLQENAPSVRTGGRASLTVRRKLATATEPAVEPEEPVQVADAPTEGDIMARIKLMRAVRSLGLIPIRESILDLMKITWYGTFKRPSEWKDHEGRTPYVDRLMFTDGRGIEYQYGADHDVIHVRQSPPPKDRNNLNEITSYGAEEPRKPTWADFRLLIVASNHFPLWYIVHGVLVPWHAFKRWREKRKAKQTPPSE